MVSRTTLSIAAVFVVIALLAAGAFAFVDFHALESQTAADTSVGTSRVNDAMAPKSQPLYLAIVGDGPIADRLATELQADLQPTWDTVVLVDELNDSMGGPVLAVGVAESEVRYNPVTPSARLEAEFAFVGSGQGETARAFALGEQPTILNNEIPYVVQGDVTMVDTSRGLASLPGYRGFLVDRLSARLTSSLTSAPGM